MAYEYSTISTRLNAGVLTAVLSNPPVNVMTPQLFADLVAFTAEVAVDEAARVVVLESADPDFFIAHFDLELILTFPIDKPARKAENLNDFNLMCERVRTMPKPTIAKLAGRVGGGGSEFSSACDMRFGLHGKTVVNQMEVPLGILPGGGGTQYLPRLMGRGRAMELILGGVDMDAGLAERWGYLNRAFNTAAELDDYVDYLARRMASFPSDALALAKQSVLNAELPLHEGLLEEAYLFQQTLRYPEATTNMQRALSLGAQTREGELDIAELSAALGRPADD
jgi:enoyl-CoA hydratase/carnithine racemase